MPEKHGGAAEVTTSTTRAKLSVQKPKRRDGITARAPFLTRSLAPVARTIRLAYHSPSQALECFKEFTDLVVFGDADEVSNESHMFILTL